MFAVLLLEDEDLVLHSLSLEVFSLSNRLYYLLLQLHVLNFPTLSSVSLSLTCLFSLSMSF